MSTTDFYRAFEDRLRGSRELIHSRLLAYKPFIAPLPDIYQPASAIDLGCGRGEWLELLQGAGYAPQGVDLDAGMLAACIERGLPVTLGDALAHLQSLGDATQCIVSGFHIAEHLAFEDLNTLVQQAFRVLKPGGLLILETPNPENVVVGTNNFYLDPTHLRPIPPLLLSFLPEHYGFARVHTVRLQEPPELHQRSDITLIDVLGGVSMDYAVVAQKAAPPDVMARFAAAFGIQYGINLNELAARYDNTNQRRLSALHKRIANTEAQASGMTDALGRIATLQDRLLEASTQLVRQQSAFEQLQAQAARTAEDLETALGHARAMESSTQEHEQRAQAAELLAQEQRQCIQDQTQRIDELGANAHHWWLQACALEAERNALLRSVSWRITAPLRFMAGLALHPASTVCNGANWALHSVINLSQRPLSVLMAAVLRRPQLSHPLSRWLRDHPALYQQLVDVALRRNVQPDAAIHWSTEDGAKGRAATELTHLTPHGREIYSILKAEIQNNNKAD